jgi:magnesium chelatase subunit D
MSQRLPFAAVVGQHEAKRALLLAAVEPLLGGVLLRGDKGSAKTTLARGLAALLPGDAPFVELPLGAGEDRVLGSLDLTELLTNASPTFRPGLLAAAHAGVLYIDEINLLADHLVDALLDVAASGVNRVERDGVSHTHPARFVLVASMNPEEGELRPQLLDRFGLSVDVSAPVNIAERVEAVRRQLKIESSAGPDDSYSVETAQLRDEVERARRTPVSLDHELLHVASSIAMDVGAEGLRADLMLVRAARANAALAGRESASVDDVRKVAEMVLSHRRRRRPFEQPGVDRDELDAAFERATMPPLVETTATQNDGRNEHDATQGHEGNLESDADQETSEGAGHAPDDRCDSPGVASPGQHAIPDVGRTRRSGESGRWGYTDGQRGRVVRTTPFAGGVAEPIASAVALATRRAADRTPDATAKAGDLRSVEREQATTTLVVFVVDASGSMGAEHRMAATKAAVIGLLGDAYRRRCRVALVSFRADGAETVLRPTASVEIARARLAELRTGGTSPIAAGLTAASQLLDGAGRDVNATIVLVTDGRASSTDCEPRAALAEAIDMATALVRRGIGLVVIDSETGSTRLGFARDLATRAGATLMALHELHDLTDAGLVARLG